MTGFYTYVIVCNST